MFFFLSDGLYIIPMAKNNQYSESSITVLKGLEPVKERPGMYTRTDSPTHICQEVIDFKRDVYLGALKELSSRFLRGMESYEDFIRRNPIENL